MQAERNRGAAREAGRGVRQEREEDEYSYYSDEDQRAPPPTKKGTRAPAGLPKSSRGQEQATRQATAQGRPRMPEGGAGRKKGAVDEDDDYTDYTPEPVAKPVAAKPARPPVTRN